MRSERKLLICTIFVFCYISLNLAASGFPSIASTTARTYQGFSLPSSFSSQVIDPDQLNFTKLGQIETGGITHRVEIVGNIAYIADFLKGFISYDISEPENPIKLDTVDYPNYYDPNAKGGHSLIIRNNIAIVDYTHGGIKLINISDPSDLREIGSFYISGVEYYGLIVSNDYVYTVIQHRDEHDELLIIDFSDISNPVEAGRYSTGYNLVTSFVYENIAFIYDDGISQLSCLNVTDPANVEEIGQIDWYPLDVEIIDNLVYVGTENQGLSIYDISEPLDLQLLDQYESGCVSDVDITGDLVSVALGNNGFKIFNASGTDLVEIGHYNGGGGTVNICIQGSIACIVKTSAEIEIVQIQGLDDGMTIQTQTQTQTSGDDGMTMRTSGFDLHIFVFLFFPCLLKDLWKKKRKE